MSCESNSCQSPLNLNDLATIGEPVKEAFSQWYQLSDKLFSQYFQLTNQWFEGYLSTVKKTLSLNPMAQPSCQIPSTECPPACVCELRWEALEGELLKGAIELSNTGDEPVAFRFKTFAFKQQCNTTDTDVVPKISPESINLAPGESQVVNLSITLADHLLQHKTPYHSKLLVLGRYEQCVKLVFEIKERALPCCVIEHGAIPKRMVPHQWYHHFQCEELCFKPIRQRIDTDINLTRG